MKAIRNTSVVSCFLKRARALYPYLGIPEKDDEQFMQFLGVSKKSYKNWYNLGIRKVYWKMLDCLERNYHLTKDKEHLTSQVRELQKQSSVRK